MVKNYNNKFMADFIEHKDIPDVINYLKKHKENKVNIEQTIAKIEREPKLKATSLLPRKERFGSEVFSNTYDDYIDFLKDDKTKCNYIEKTKKEIKNFVRKNKAILSLSKEKQNDFKGAYPDVPRFLSNLPKNMKHKKNNLHKNKVTFFSYLMSFNGNKSIKHIVETNGKFLKLVILSSLLQRKNTYFFIFLGSTFSSSLKGDKYMYYILSFLNVSKLIENNLNKAIEFICCGDIYRILFFARIEQAVVNEYTYHKNKKQLSSYTTGFKSYTYGQPIRSLGNSSIQKILNDKFQGMNVANHTLSSHQIFEMDEEEIINFFNKEEQ